MDCFVLPVGGPVTDGAKKGSSVSSSFKGCLRQGPADCASVGHLRNEKEQDHIGPTLRSTRYRIQAEVADFPVINWQIETVLRSTSTEAIATRLSISIDVTGILAHHRGKGATDDAL